MASKTSSLALGIALAALAISIMHLGKSTTLVEKKENAFERVMRTGTIRCGYGIWAPGLTKDPKTGELGGIFYDYLNALGKHAGLKVEWTGEIGWSDFPAALNEGRVDAICFGAWPKAPVAREVEFTKPIYFLPVDAYARAGDDRFDHAQEKIDSPDVTISVMDGEISTLLATQNFPKAKTFSIPQLSGSSNLLLNVTTGKADLTFTDAWTAADFMKVNPGKIKRVPLNAPLRLFGHTIPVAQRENTFVNFLNAATDELINTGELDAIIKKYEGDMPGVLLHLPRPYENPGTR
jgi:ABC-type amino acid transport substrate-binding protein